MKEKLLTYILLEPQPQSKKKKKKKTRKFKQVRPTHTKIQKDNVEVMTLTMNSYLRKG